MTDNNRAGRKDMGFGKVDVQRQKTKLDSVGGSGRHANWIPASKSRPFYVLLRKIIAHTGSHDEAIKSIPLPCQVHSSLAQGGRISELHAKRILDYYNKHVKTDQSSEVQS